MLASIPYTLVTKHHAWYLNGESSIVTIQIFTTVCSTYLQASHFDKLNETKGILFHVFPAHKMLPFIIINVPAFIITNVERFSYALHQSPTSYHGFIISPDSYHSFLRYEQLEDHASSCKLARRNDKIIIIRKSINVYRTLFFCFTFVHFTNNHSEWQSFSCQSSSCVSLFFYIARVNGLLKLVNSNFTFIVCYFLFHI